MKKKNQQQQSTDTWHFTYSEVKCKEQTQEIKQDHQRASRAETCAIKCG